MVSSLWLPAGATVADALAAQAQQTQRVGSHALDAPDEEWTAALGMGRAEVMARLLSLVLYLCSEDTDVARRQVPTATASPRPSARRETAVLSAGFRLGAALRTATTAQARSTDEGSGRRVAPHLRRAHWHHYWAGSEARQNRHLKLHWIPPVSVNADLRDELVTVVRPVGEG